MKDNKCTCTSHTIADMICCPKHNKEISMGEYLLKEKKRIALKKKKLNWLDIDED